jgi:AcrR family transcriptional regulator
VAVELRPEESRRGLQDLVGSAELPVLSLQGLESLPLVGGDARRSPPSISARRTHLRSVSGAMPNFSAMEGDRRPLRGVLLLLVEDHPDGPLAYLPWIPSQRLEPPGNPGTVRVPRDTLTRDRIVRTAIEFLDDHGLEGFNMRSLGRRLGSAATAVCWHVDSKHSLIRLAGDEVWNEIDLPDLSTVGWRTAATMMARNLYGMLIRHAWLVTAFSSELLYGPGKTRHDDYSLAVYEKAGFVGAAQADRAAATVFMFVLGNAWGSRPRSR